MARRHDPTDPLRPALAALAVGMRRLREQAGLSQRALAEQMSYVREYVTLAERGSRLPSREFLVRYAHALDATEKLLPLYDAAWREDQAVKRAARVRRYQQKLGVTEHDAARLDGMIGPYVTKLDPDMQRRLFIQALLATGGAVLARDDGRPAPATGADTTVDAIRSVTEQYRLLEATTPSAELQAPVLAHLQLAANRLDADPSAQLAAAASEAAGFAGWLAVDRGDHRQARRHYQQAVDHADRSGSGVLAAYMLGSMSLWAADLGLASEALSLIGRAHRRLPDRVPPTVAAWTAAVEAVAHAARHDAQAALAALGRAEASTREDAEPLWPWVYPFTNTRLASYRGGCATRLNLHALAVPALQQALAGFGPTATKAKALTLTDLAASYLAAADVEQACARAGEALEIGVEQRSQRIVGRVLAVRAQMASLHSAVAVQALDQRILATLLPSSGP
jgi:transcriptional regulator with XRE-family HTH domain